ncbi:MAG TPA: FtsW/RodA/SpoVE family cell cycle protein [Microthrixaceae bacterium]|nr:FtsW/RodA/SpoVE family cell cycle protein [Microthrixaceae bacterium]
MMTSSRGRTDPRRRLPDARATRSRIRRERREVARGEIPTEFWALLASVTMLCCVGLVAVFSSTTVRSIAGGDAPTAFLSRHALFLGIGAVLMFAGYKVGYRRVSLLAPLALGSAATLLVAVLIFGSTYNGARRWFSFGFVTFQPSELAKLAIIVWVARLLAMREREMHLPGRTVMPVAVVVGLAGFVIYLEPDLGTAVVLAAVAATMLVVAGARLDALFGLAIPVGATFLALSQRGYHKDRWGFLDPLSNANHENYQLLGGLSSIANGGWFGVGPGGSSAKWGYLPEAESDAIFAVVAEEFGILGAMLVIGLYVVILVCGIRVAYKAADRFGRLLAIGITTMISIQTFVNIGVVLGVLPNKGFTLPFISYGGTSLVMSLAAMGLLLSVAREGDAAQARLRRRQRSNRRLAKRAPSRGALVLAASDGRSTESRPRRRTPAKSAARQPAARKPAARQPAAKKPAARQPARQPAAKKSAPRQPAQRRSSTGRAAQR